MKTPDGTVTDGSVQPRADADDTNMTERDTTNGAGQDTSGVQSATAAGGSVERTDGEGTEGEQNAAFPVSAPAIASVHARACTETYCKDGAPRDVTSVIVAGESASGNAAAQVEPSLMPIESVQENNAVVHDSPHDPYHQDQQGYGFGARGRGAFRGARGGFRGRGGAYGTYTTPGEPEQPPAPPVNAPTGPKAMRAGLPNSGWYSRPQPQQPSAPAVSPQTQIGKSKGPELDVCGRSPSKSRSRSRTRDRKERHKSPNGTDESVEAYSSRKDRDNRKRKERDDDLNGGDESSRKYRSRSHSRDRDRSKRHHRDKDEDRRESRSHRDRSREKHRRRHRSRSPERDASVNGNGSDPSRRKSKSDRRRETEYEDSDRVKDKARSRRHSRRDDDQEYESKERSSHSSRHQRASRDERDREKDKPSDEDDFKILGSSKKQATAMGPPASLGRDRSERRSSIQQQDSTPATPITPTLDPYAAEREAAQKRRMERNAERRQSTQSLGKRGREEDEIEAPTGPSGDRSGGKKQKRKMEYKYEDEIRDGYDERETKRWR